MTKVYTNEENNEYGGDFMSNATLMICQSNCEIKISRRGLNRSPEANRTIIWIGELRRPRE